jgi:putative hydrolase of the HAD superfamily
MIEAVLWDFGGVFTASPFHAIRTWAPTVGLDGDVVLELLFGRYEDDGDHPWHRLERGEMAMVDTFAAIASAAEARGVALDIKALFGAMAHDPFDRSMVLELAHELRARGLRMAVVTNNAREFADAWKKLVPVDHLFDDVIDSSEVGVRKPNPRIYELALERLGVTDPARAVFLDDFEPNVVAARRLGLHGVHVAPDPAAAMAELAALVGR